MTVCSVLLFRFKEGRKGSADAGLQVNDEIVAINGTASRQLSGWDFRRAVRLRPETKLTLSVVRSGQPQTVVLTLRELLP